MKISVCIPMYNENQIIAHSARTLSQYMEENFADYELLFYSDGSTDGCDETVRALHLPHTRVISESPNRGKGYTVHRAMLAATGDIRIFTDADLAYGTDVIKCIADRFESTPDADVIIGSRNLCRDGYKGYTWARKVASKAYIRILCLIGGVKVTDSQCGCKAYRAEAAERIFSRCEVNGFAFDFETLLWAKKLGLRVCELPVYVIHHGTSKVCVFKDSLRMLRDLAKMKNRIKKAEVQET